MPGCALGRFHFGECLTLDTARRIANLRADSELQAQYKELNASKNALDATQMQPSAATVLNILSYARGMQEHR